MTDRSANIIVVVTVTVATSIKREKETHTHGHRAQRRDGEGAHLNARSMDRYAAREPASVAAASDVDGSQRRAVSSSSKAPRS